MTQRYWYIYRVKYLLALLLLSFQNSFAQYQVSGVILNSLDKTPLPSASIFINNSSKGTMADADGKFLISNISDSEFELVASYAGYIPVSIKINPSNINKYYTIILQPRELVMNEVAVQAPDKNGWAKWGKQFITYFLGTSDFASQTVIQNPKVLRFFYDERSGMLTAYSNENLIIKNNALGYMIRYQLEEFTIDKHNQMVSFAGYTVYEDMVAKNNRTKDKWMQNRDVAFKGSIMHFMRALYNDSLVSEGFEIFERRVPEADTTFPIQTICKRNSDEQLIFDLNAKTFRVIYKRSRLRKSYLHQNVWTLRSPYPTSNIQAITPEPLIVISNGLYHNPVNLVTDGYWGWCKTADMLPSDYVDQK